MAKKSTTEEKAKSLARPESDEDDSKELPEDTSIQAATCKEEETANSCAQTTFRVTVYTGQFTGKCAARYLGSWPCSSYDGRIELLLQDDEFFVEVHRRLKEKAIDVNDLQAVYVRKGRKGTPVRISLNGLVA